MFVLEYVSTMVRELYYWQLLMRARLIGWERYGELRWVLAKNKVLRRRLKEYERAQRRRTT
jgi:hypothetical protein